MNIQKARKSLQTRKGNTMKNMTKHDALVYALNTVIEYNDNSEVCEVLTTMIAQLSKPRKTSDTAKANAKAKRANARAELMKDILPTLRDALTMYPDGLTAKALYETCAETLPEGFTTAKVQYILLHELADEVVKTEAKNKPNVYTLR